MEERFRFIALQEARDFLASLDNKTRKKVFYNIWKSKSINDNNLFKPIQDEIWEFRTYFNKQYIRLFAFWDKKDGQDVVVVGTHGIYKKTERISKSDINKAKRIRRKYLNERK